MLTSLILQWLLFTTTLLFNPSYCFSACDEIDITFVIDVNSIIANSENIISFITKIIENGSSEHAGFSAVIYGHNIPSHQKIKIISLHDTKSATQRKKAEQAIDDALQNAFKKIKSAQTTSASVKSIDLVPAFKIATDQSRPKTTSVRQRRLGYDPNDSKQTVMGQHDGQQIYFVFDHNNDLLDETSDVDICELFRHLDANQIKNDDEAPYFLLGRPFKQRQIENV